VVKLTKNLKAIKSKR